MTTDQALLLKIMEECNELSHRASKAIRFGLEEIQVNDNENPEKLNNAYRMREEFLDLTVAIQRVIGPITDYSLDEVKIRNERIDSYLQYSKELGMIRD